MTVAAAAIAHEASVGDESAAAAAASRAASLHCTNTFLVCTV